MPPSCTVARLAQDKYLVFGTYVDWLLSGYDVSKMLAPDQILDASSLLAGRRLTDGLFDVASGNFSPCGSPDLWMLANVSQGFVKSINAVRNAGQIRM